MKFISRWLVSVSADDGIRLFIPLLASALAVVLLWSIAPLEVLICLTLVVVVLAGRAFQQSRSKHLVHQLRKLKYCVNDLEKQLAQRNAQLEEAAGFIDGFCNSIAHDLRAPLRAMHGYVHVLREDYAVMFDAQGRDYADKIASASRKMDRLVQNLIDYGRLNRGQLVLNAVHLDQSLKTVLWKFQEEIRQRGAQISVRGPLGHVQADKAVLEMVLTQLISNALKFNRVGGRIRIKIFTSEQGEFIRMSIQDNGIGIEARYAERIFGLFEQLSRSGDDATGAGLAIAKRGVEQMGGRIGLQSEVGKGSCFWFELPKADNHDWTQSDLEENRRNESALRQG